MKLVFITAVLLISFALGQEQQDLNKSRTEIILNASRLNVTDHMRIAENEIAAITNIAAQLLQENKMLRHENDSLKASKKKDKSDGG